MLSRTRFDFTTTTSCGQRRRQAPTPCGQQSPRNISFSKQSCCCTALCGGSRASKNGNTKHKYGELHMIRLGPWNPGAGARTESLDMGNQACRGIAGRRDDPPGARKRLVNQCAVEIQASRAPRMPAAENRRRRGAREAGGGIALSRPAAREQSRRYRPCPIRAGPCDTSRVVTQVLNASSFFRNTAAAVEVASCGQCPIRRHRGLAPARRKSRYVRSGKTAPVDQCHGRGHRHGR